jgi:hypothetical protein
MRDSESFASILDLTIEEPGDQVSISIDFNPDEQFRVSTAEGFNFSFPTLGTGLTQRLAVDRAVQAREAELAEPGSEPERDLLLLAYPTSHDAVVVLADLLWNDRVTSLPTPATQGHT